jgi:hypothetical protein
MIACREMSGKFKACTALAEAVIKLGFKCKPNPQPKTELLLMLI